MVLNISEFGFGWVCWFDRSEFTVVGLLWGGLWWRLVLSGIGLFVVGFPRTWRFWCFELLSVCLVWHLYWIFCSLVCWGLVISGLGVDIWVYVIGLV